MQVPRFTYKRWTLKKAIPKDDSEVSEDRKKPIEEPNIKDLGLADSY